MKSCGRKFAGRRFIVVKEGTHAHERHKTICRRSSPLARLLERIKPVRGSYFRGQGSERVINRLQGYSHWKNEEKPKLIKNMGLPEDHPTTSHSDEVLPKGFNEGDSYQQSKTQKKIRRAGVNLSLRRGQSKCWTQLTLFEGTSHQTKQFCRGGQGGTHPAISMGQPTS